MGKTTIVSKIKIVTTGTEAACRRALTIIGGMAETHAKEKVLVDTGRLKNSITNKVAEDGKSVTIGTNVVYAPFIELGTGIHASNGEGRKTAWHYKDAKGKWHTTHGMEPHPYLRPALEDYAEDYKTVVENEMKKG